VPSDSVPFKKVVIDASSILDWPSFHAVFSKAFGFPDFYGRNMNAWIDCMSDLDTPDAGMSTVHAPPNGIVLVEILNAKAFSKRCPEQAAALSDSAAFVNWRRCEQGGAPVLALSYHQ
jgi:RNAse (barnase) inhibitor barstar